MALFGKMKKVEKAYCSRNITAENMAQAVQNEGSAVKILGSGCKKCNELEANTKAALEQLGMDTTIDHVRDFTAIAAYGVMTTPALVIGTKIVSAGKVLKTNEVITLIQKTII